jgi:hypothetical protein
MLAATPGAVCSSQRRDCETAARLCQHRRVLKPVEANSSPKHLIARDHCKTEVRTSPIYLLVGCRGVQERTSVAQKSEFTEPEHAVFGTAVEVSNIH